MPICTTSTTTTQPCHAPFPPSEMAALIPNPATMTTCEEMVKGIIDFREKVLDWISWMLTPTGDLSDAFRCLFCGLDCSNVELGGTRWEMPCVPPDTGSSSICPCNNPSDQYKTIVGDPAVLYNVTLRFRGFIEPKQYIGGSNDGVWFQTGGIPDPFDPGGYNIYAIETADPPQIYYLNRANATFVGPPYAYAIDYTATIQVRGGSVITVHADSVDGQQISNHTGVVVSGVAPDPEAYNGQFIQVDVISVTPA